MNNCILILDDHDIILKGLRTLITNNIPGNRIHLANSESMAYKILNKETINLLILDINIPSFDVFSVLEKVTTDWPSTKILVFSMYPETIYAKRMYKKGVMGYLSKESDSNEIVKAIRLVLLNKRYFSDRWKEIISNDLIMSDNLNVLEELSDRELQIAKLLAEGKSLKSIENLLHLHKSTISTFKSRIFQKLKVQNVIELHDLCVNHGLVWQEIQSDFMTASIYPIKGNSSAKFGQ